MMLVEIQWIEAITKAGLIGGFAYLLIWFTRIHIPNLQTQREKELEMAQEERAANDLRAKQQRDDYLRAMKEEADECRKERSQLAKDYRAEREADRAARHDLANAIQGVRAELHRLSPDGYRIPYDDNKPR